MWSGARSAGSGPPPPRVPPYDLYADSEVSSFADETLLTQTLMGKAMKLLPLDHISTALSDLNVKMKKALDQFGMLSTFLPEVKVLEIGDPQYVSESGIYHCEVVVVLSNTPSYDILYAMGNKIAEIYRSTNDGQVISITPKDYGLQFTSITNYQWRMMVSTSATNFHLLEPILHLPEARVFENFITIRRAQWLKDCVSTIPLKELVRVVKDMQSRITGLRHLSSWTVEYLCYYNIIFTTDRIPLAIGPAFRRVFSLLAAGCLLPSSAGTCIIDPVEPAIKIELDLTPAQADEVCGVAQLINRMILNGGYDELINPKDSRDITRHPFYCNGITIGPFRPVYIENYRPRKIESSIF